MPLSRIVSGAISSELALPLALMKQLTMKGITRYKYSSDWCLDTNVKCHFHPSLSWLLSSDVQPDLFRLKHMNRD